MFYLNIIKNRPVLNALVHLLFFLQLEYVLKFDLVSVYFNHLCHSAQIDRVKFKTLIQLVFYMQMY